MYESTSDEKLRELSARRELLTPESRLALDAECERRGLFPPPAPDQDPLFPEGATPCADHPVRAVSGVCRRCGRFICFRCDPAVGQGYVLSSDPPQGVCPACRPLLGEGVAPLPIGGWLLLLGLGLVVSPFVQAGTLLQTFRFLVSAQLSPVALTVVMIDVALSVGALGVTCYAVLRFTGKKKDAPLWVMGLFATSVVLLVLELGFERMLGGEVTWGNGTGMRGLTGTLYRAAIWIPYLRLSKRVKATFVLP